MHVYHLSHLYNIQHAHPHIQMYGWIYIYSSRLIPQTIAYIYNTCMYVCGRL